MSLTKSFISPQEPTSETIWFDFTFETSYWDQPPWVEIYIDHQFHGKYIISHALEKISVQQQLMFGNHRLTIVRGGKDNSQTRMMPDDGFQTQILTLASLSIDRTNIRNLIWHDSVFTPRYPEPWASQQQSAGIALEQSVTGELIFGHNGIWEFDFSSPFYKYIAARISKK